MEEKAQISVELIIVLAAVVAVVLLLVTQLQETASQGATKMEKTAGDVFKKIDKI
jgi:preprotein translocase subunit SecG